MLHEIQGLLPTGPMGPAGLYTAIAVFVVGCALWFAGVHFSRALLTLIAVFTGAALGKALPVWCNWNSDGMGPAVGLAVSFGTCAFAMHRMWIGLMLGIVG